jgi:hypothetical protein
VNRADPSGLCVSLFNAVCVGGGPVSSTPSFKFNPGAAANATVNIGRGASFGLSDTIANWISPGASCTVAQNGLDQAPGQPQPLWLRWVQVLSLKGDLPQSLHSWSSVAKPVARSGKDETTVATDDLRAVQARRRP